MQTSEVTAWLTKMYGTKITVQEDAARNALMIGGQSDDVASAIDTIRVLDQPRMRGQGSARIDPMFWSAQELGAKLNEILVSEGYRSAMTATSNTPIIILPVQAINAIIVFASDPAILAEGRALPLSLIGSGHARSADLVATFAGHEEPDEWGLPGHAPFDAPDVPEGGGMHGGLHRAELATVLVMQGGPVRRGAVAEEPADLTDIVPTVLHMLGLAPEGMEGRPLRAALDAAADAPPARETIDLPGGFVLEAMRAPAGRFYPTALRKVR